jgi:hypothetical protein
MGNVCGKKWNANVYNNPESIVALIHVKGERRESFM